MCKRHFGGSAFELQNKLMSQVLKGQQLFTQMASRRPSEVPSGRSFSGVQALHRPPWTPRSSPGSSRHCRHCQTPCSVAVYPPRPNGGCSATHASCGCLRPGSCHKNVGELRCLQETPRGPAHCIQAILCKSVLFGCELFVRVGWHFRVLDQGWDLTNHRIRTLSPC